MKRRGREKRKWSERKGRWEKSEKKNKVRERR